MELEDEEQSVNYRKFKKEVFRQIEDADVDAGEEYPTAIFMVDRENNVEIITLEEYIEEHDFDEDMLLSDIVQEHFPEEVSSFNSKFFALVFPADYEGQDSSPIVAVLLGGLFQSEIYYASVFSEDDKLYVEDWEKDDPRSYPNISIPFRRAITLQG